MRRRRRTRKKRKMKVIMTMRLNIVRTIRMRIVHMWGYVRVMRIRMCAMLNMWTK